MGMAEIVPGVSGGTIAFISGIYEELIDTIKSFDASLIKTLFQGNWKMVREKSNLTFLLPLLVGMFAGIVLGIFAIDYFIHKYPVIVWSFFIGLIIASAIFIVGQVKKWNALNAIFLLLGIAIAVIISSLPMAGGDVSLLYLFFSGAIAICALILPGISGSFILLLLGVYVYITGSIKTFLSALDFSLLIPIVVFAFGCLLGLVVFSRVVSYTFKKFPNKTLLLLTGFIIGALYKIWPWRNPISWIDDEGNRIMYSAVTVVNDEWHILEEVHVWPNNYFAEPMVIGAVISSIVGFLLVFVLTKIPNQNEDS